MPRERIVGSLDKSLMPEWKAIVEKLGGGESAAVGWVIYQEILRRRNRETKGDLLAQLLGEQRQQRQLLDMLLMIVGGIAVGEEGETIELSAPKARRLRDAILRVVQEIGESERTEENEQ